MIHRTDRVAWWFADGKPGHDNQALGLLEALAERVPLQVERIAPLPRARALAGLLGGRIPPLSGLPPPQLILGAGHGTHLSLLAARRRYGGRSIVLMRPSLPLGLFDLCLIPAHDNPPERPNIIVTRGALNRLRPAVPRDGSALILLGGPSRHHRWDDDAVHAQVERLLEAWPDRDWVLANSRRTPAALWSRLTDLAGARGLPAVDWVTAGPDWLPGALSRAAEAWVSADSVSMLYEALSAGAAVGLLEVPLQSGCSPRIGAGVESLVAEGRVTPLGLALDRGGLPAPAAPLAEAARCADWIAEHWLGA